MFTFSLIKECAHELEIYELHEGKLFAERYHLFGLWWAYDASEMYQHFTLLQDKLFWWKMTVKSLRFANKLQRNKVK